MTSTCLQSGVELQDDMEVMRKDLAATEKRAKDFEAQVSQLKKGAQVRFLFHVLHDSSQRNKL